MIPLAAVVRVHTGQVRFGLWLPLLLVWVLLAPFAILLSPFVLIAGWAMGMNPVRSLAAAMGLVCALPGVLVEVESPGATVLVRII